MSDEEIIEVVSALKANDKTMKDNGISDNLWEKPLNVSCFCNIAFRFRCLGKDSRHQSPLHSIAPAL